MDELGFKPNPYDACMVNKMIDSKQCTALWHVDDIKMSHASQELLDSIADKIAKKYGQESPLMIHRGRYCS